MIPEGDSSPNEIKEDSKNEDDEDDAEMDGNDSKEDSSPSDEGSSASDSMENDEEQSSRHYLRKLDKLNNALKGLETELKDAKKPRKRELKPGNYARNQAKIKEDRINALKDKIKVASSKKYKYEKILKGLVDGVGDKNPAEDDDDQDDNSMSNQDEEEEEEDDEEQVDEVIEGSVVKKDVLNQPKASKYFVEFNIRQQKDFESCLIENQIVVKSQRLVVLSDMRIKDVRKYVYYSIKDKFEEIQPRNIELAYRHSIQTPIFL